MSSSSSTTHKIRHVQLVWRHDNIFPTKRIRLECVLLLPTEPAKQTPLTPTASAAVDIKKGYILDGCAMDDNDEPWLSETDHRTDWNKDFKSGTYLGMLYGIGLRDYPIQVISLAKANSVPANVRESLSTSL